MDTATPIRQLRFAAIDFESAGAARGRTDVPVQVGVATWSPATGHGQYFVSYLRADRPVTWSARKVHGITDADLVDAPSLIELWPVLRDLLGGAVVLAHAKGTEKRFLRAFPGHGFGPWVDSLHLARAAWPDLPSHTLSALCDALQLTPAIQQLVPDRRWHDALFDAAASAALTAAILEKADLLDQPLATLLHPDQSRWQATRRRLI